MIEILICWVIHFNFNFFIPCLCCLNWDIGHPVGVFIRGRPGKTLLYSLCVMTTLTAALVRFSVEIGHQSSQDNLLQSSSVPVFFFFDLQVFHWEFPSTAVYYISSDSWGAVSAGRCLERRVSIIDLLQVFNLQDNRLHRSSWTLEAFQDHPSWIEFASCVGHVGNWLPYWIHPSSYLVTPFHDQIYVRDIGSSVEERSQQNTCPTIYGKYYSGK